MADYRCDGCGYLQCRCPKKEYPYSPIKRPTNEVIAIAQFVHSSGCERGMPYGECGYNCRWHVVKTFQHEKRVPELNPYLEKFGYLVAKFKPQSKPKRWEADCDHPKHPFDGDECDDR
jgi:hypothetical protein